MYQYVALLGAAAFGAYTLRGAWRMARHPHVPTRGSDGRARWNRMVLVQQVVIGAGLLLAVAAVLLT